MAEGSALETNRHPHNALTARAVKAARANGRVQRRADGGGLYLVVTPAGSMSWVLRRVVKGRRCDLGLGSAALVSLADARDEAAWLCPGLRSKLHAAIVRTSASGT
jgi:hypothetical protein